MSTLTVAEAAAYLDMSPHTLRYYERAGLLSPVPRNGSGHRRYAAADLDRLRFLHCLRATGMSIRRMREYATLAEAGASTLAARTALLEQHRRDVQARIDAFGQLLGMIDAKLDRLAEAAQELTAGA